MSESSAIPGDRNGTQGEPAAGSRSSPPETPSPEVALAIRAQAKAERPRIGGVLAHRFEHFRARMEKQLMRDVGTLELSRYAFLDDIELATVVHNGRRLTRREQRIARSWEVSKKEVPMALLAAHERVVNTMRSQTETKAISINVERAVIRVPDTKPERDEDAIIIDAEVT